MSIFDDIESIGGDVVDAIEDVGSSLVDVASDLFEGPGQLVGIAMAGGAFFVVGPSWVIPAFVTGSVGGNALIRHRPLNDAERGLADRVFVGRNALPDNDRIVLTNFAGLDGRAFVAPTATQVLVNLGDSFDDPMAPTPAYPGRGQLLVHEMVHVWQVHHSSFEPGWLCEGIAVQLGGGDYAVGGGGKRWDDYNIEQQATIVDEWFAPRPRIADRPPVHRQMREEHPFFTYVEHDVRKRPIRRMHPATRAAMAAARVHDHLDVFWIGRDGAIRSTWWDADPGRWAQPFSVAPSGSGAPATSPAVVGRRPDHIDVFWTTPDGAIGSTWWHIEEGMSWADHHPFTIAGPGSARPGSPVAAVGREREHLDVFWIRPDGAVASTWWSAAPGHRWADHEPFTITAPGAARSDSDLVALSRVANHLDVFWVAPDGAVTSTWWGAASGHGWAGHEPFAISPPGAARPGSPVTAVARMPDHLDVFWIATDGAVASTWWSGTAGRGWNATPFAITPPGAAAPDSSLTVVSRNAEHLDIFWVTSDGAVASTWWNAAPGHGWADHPPFTITGPGAAAPRSPLATVAREPDHLDTFWINRDLAIASTWWDAAPGHGWADHPPFTVTPRAAV